MPHLAEIDNVHGDRILLQFLAEFDLVAVDEAHVEHANLEALYTWARSKGYVVHVASYNVTLPKGEEGSRGSPEADPPASGSLLAPLSGAQQDSGGGAIASISQEALVSSTQVELDDDKQGGTVCKNSSGTTSSL